ncbi:V-type ATPase subunit [Pseudoflavonifractor phocaeensis]|uniref:V-type ATPase subunit n=1 Tax=Pseudoflavonifractor phocaeensis TaxID=1870988 RepID=UPI0019568B3F|nr:V-type ATPase subunit [Pseudoflavonifractor phocaeensis]MBM6925674.1 V-type ATPase subunit [Pseudoflavonifractor phocaeensis]
MAKIKDTDYLSISARIRAMENRLLTRERMERMLDARSDEEAVKVLSECGYGELDGLTNAGLDQMLSAARGALYKDLKGAVPDPRLVEVFQLKYDYHNAKTLIKAAAVGTDPDRLLMEGGRWTAAQIKEAYHRDSLRDFTDTFRQAIVQARELLNAGNDPQLADFILDRAYFAEMGQLARETGSDFLQGYVKLFIDATNLRSAVRAARMGKGGDFLNQVLLPGGNVEPHVYTSGKGSDLAALFRAGPLGEAANLGSTLTAPGSGELTAFERACDNAVMGYLAQARRIPFGEQAVIGYLYARESEFTAIRTILSGRMAGLEGDTIRERLREAYV